MIVPAPNNALIAAPPRWFWEWADGGETIAWHDGPTLAFSSEILDIIARLGPAEMPPLGAVLLMLAALRENWSEEPPRRDRLRALMRLHGNSGDLEILEQVLPLLDRVHALPAAVRANPRTKIELAAQIFAGLADRSRSATDKAKLEQALQQRNLGEVLLVPVANIFIKKHLRRDLACLDIGLASLDEGRFHSLLDTGLEKVPEPAPIPIPAPLTGRQLLARLKEDEALGAVARLTQRLLSLTHLPRALDDPHDLPLGGVTDIAPRGSLDRLLLSELAYDDDVLAVRVAMNEALYLRREAPPKHQIRQRRVLIDIGIRMWGVPRVYAMAVGMALAINNEARENVRLNYWQKNKLHEITATSPDDWRQLLAALDPLPEPGAAIPALLESVENDDEALEPVLVTCLETMSDHEFQRALAPCARLGCYIAVVNRAGGYQLWQHTLAGSRLISQANLDLDQLLADPEPTALPLVDPQRGGDLPASFLQPRFPLRLGHDVKLENSWEIADGKVLTLTSDGRLLLWDDPKRGALQVAQGLPPGKILTCKHDESKIDLVIGALGSEAMHYVRLTSQGEVRERVPLKMNLATPREVLLRNGIVLIFSDKEVVAVACATGNQITRARLPRDHGYKPAWRKGRFLPLSAPPCTRWQAIDFDGQQIVFADLELVKSNPKLSTVDKIELVFEPQGNQGPQALLSNGMVYGLENNTLIKSEHAGLAARPWMIDVSRDGHRLLMNGEYLFDMTTIKWKSVRGTYLDGLLEPRLGNRSSITLWYKFEELVWDPHMYDLGLLNRRGKVSWFDENLAIKMTNRDMDSGFIKMPWTRVRHPNLHGVLLHQTEFSDGSIVYKDNRGLLHFRSSDMEIPEFTIIVAGGHSAGWAADGRQWGNDYFHHAESKLTSVEKIREQMIKPFLARLR
jgi:hypothetical protein